MKKVYLFCSAGMSTSILASKMQEVANSHNLPIKVAAFSPSRPFRRLQSPCPCTLSRRNNGSGSRRCTASPRGLTR